MFGRGKNGRLDWRKAYSESRSEWGSEVVWKNRKRSKLNSAVRYICFGIIGFFILFLILLAINISSLKVLYQEVSAGETNMQQALESLRSGKYAAAAKYAGYARDNFNHAAGVVDNYRHNGVVKAVPVLSQEQNNLYDLLKAAAVLSRAGKDFSILARNLNTISGDKGTNFTDLPTAKKRQVLKYLYENTPELTGINANVELAAYEFHEFEETILFWPLKPTVRQAARRLDRVRDNLDKAMPIAKLAPEALGYPERKNFLLALQNSDELRPTGGFLGTYGILSTKSGEILRSDTHDIYHMDMPVKDKLAIEPPAPLKEYLGVDKWFMRDANWSPDWPTAARKFEWFYHEENPLLPPKDRINDFSDEFDGVIGITPEFVEKLLAITGPVKIGDETYTQDNFHRLLQYRVEKGYQQLGVPSWHRKEVIGDILAELKQRVFAMTPQGYQQTFELLIQGLDTKDVLLYFKDDHLARIAQRTDWSGAVKRKSGDYVYAVDANMASLKTDAVMEREMDYKLQNDPNGATAELRLQYTHTGDFDWRTTRYRTYTRIYVPLGCELLEAKGFAGHLNPKHKLDVYEEFGYTVFAGFISTEPGETQNVKIKYSFAQDHMINQDPDKYRLFIQKQPGRDISDLDVSLNFYKPIQKYAPAETSDRPGDTRIEWDTDLEQDREFRVTF